MPRKCFWDCENVIRAQLAEVVQVHELRVEDAVLAHRPERPEVQEWLRLLRQPAVAGLLQQVPPGADVKAAESWYDILVFLPHCTSLLTYALY